MSFHLYKILVRLNFFFGRMCCGMVSLLFYPITFTYALYLVTREKLYLPASISLALLQPCLLFLLHTFCLFSHNGNIDKTSWISTSKQWETACPRHTSKFLTIIVCLPYLLYLFTLLTRVFIMVSKFKNRYIGRSFYRLLHGKRHHTYQ